MADVCLPVIDSDRSEECADGIMMESSAFRKVHKRRNRTHTHQSSLSLVNSNRCKTIFIVSQNAFQRHSVNTLFNLKIRNRIYSQLVDVRNLFIRANYRIFLVSFALRTHFDVNNSTRFENVLSISLHRLDHLSWFLWFDYDERTFTCNWKYRYGACTA